MKDFALKYLNAGFSVVPVVKGEKRPAIAWEEYTRRLPTIEEVNDWWQTEMGIAIITGKVSNLSVVDVDAKSGGIETLKKLRLPITKTVMTGGGGYHYYFRYHPHVHSTAGILQGIDTRSDGGLVIAPPSFHASGKRYTWAPIDEALAEFPIHLFNFGQKKDIPKLILNGTTSGSRNSDATIVCGKYLSMFDKSQWESAVWPMLLAWNTKVNPPLGETELRQIFLNITKAENKNRPEPIPIITTKTENHLPKIRENLQKKRTFFTWGDAVIDEKMPLLEVGTYAVLFGQMGSGKTTWAMYIARRNQNTTFLTLEMSKEKLIRNYAFARLGITKERYKVGDFDENKIIEICHELDNINFIGLEDETKKEIFTTETIEKIIQEQKPEFLIIDNLNKISGGDKKELDITMQVSNDLLSITRRYPICILVLHHANKPLKNQEASGLRGLSGMRGTQKTGDDVDVLVEIARPPENSNDLVAIFNKNLSNVAVYKDRDFDTRSKFSLIYSNGFFQFSC